MKDVFVLGSSTLRSELLVSSLERAQPDTFSFTIAEASLATIDVARARSSTFLAFVDDERAQATRIARQLRTDYFCWEPLHLLMREPPHSQVLAADWAIYFHATPPDARALADMLVRSESLSS